MHRVITQENLPSLSTCFSKAVQEMVENCSQNETLTVPSQFSTERKPNLQQQTTGGSQIIGSHCS